MEGLEDAVEAEREPLSDFALTRLLAMASSCSSTNKVRCSGGRGVSEAFKTLEESSWIRAYVVFRSLDEGCARCWLALVVACGRDGCLYAFVCEGLYRASLSPTIRCCLLKVRLLHRCRCNAAAGRNGVVSWMLRKIEMQSLHTANLRNSIVAIVCTEYLISSQQKLLCLCQTSRIPNWNRARRPCTASHQAL